ncbi:hypothetical protein SOP84_19550, partial [Kocuria rosea]|nr:hypothetical protein [Kocuria rosea]
SGFHVRSGTKDVISSGVAVGSGSGSDTDSVGTSSDVAGSLAGTGTASGIASSVTGADVVAGSGTARSGGTVLVVGDGDGEGASFIATAGTALPMRLMDSKAAHRSRAGEGKVTGFSSRIRALAS